MGEEITGETNNMVSKMREKRETKKIILPNQKKVGEKNQKGTTHMDNPINREREKKEGGAINITKRGGRDQQGGSTSWKQGGRGLRVGSKQIISKRRRQQET